jgi:hypothetical protein
LATERFPVAVPDQFGETNLFLTGNQRILADLAQILIERALVGRDLSG